MEEHPEGVGNKERPKVYIGREREADFWSAVKAFEGPMVSPGGVCERLRCSRQFVWKLIGKGHLYALIWRKRLGDPAGYCMIPLEDVDAYAAAEKDKGGRPRKTG